MNFWYISHFSLKTLINIIDSGYQKVKCWDNCTTPRNTSECTIFVLHFKESESLFKNGVGVSVAALYLYQKNETTYLWKKYQISYSKSVILSLEGGKNLWISLFFPVFPGEASDNLFKWSHLDNLRDWKLCCVF